MECPNCKEPMEPRKIANVNIDECVKCKGLWFDRGELEQAKDEVEPDLRWMDFELWKDQGSFQVKENPLWCPRCREVAMAAIADARVGVEIKYCPACQGIWLEAGDFEKIIHVLLRESDSQSASDYIRVSLKEAREIVGNPENLISEWRDLKAVLRLLKYRVFVENPRLRNILVGIQKSLPL